MEKIKYNVFKIPKRNGKFRKIEQPVGKGMEILKKKLAQLEKMKELKPSYYAHAYMRGRNIITCAKQHFGNKYIIRVDIKDFFGSMSLSGFENVLKRHSKGLNITSEKQEEILKEIKICFREKTITKKVLDEETQKMKIVKEKTTYLPQGSPTSPFLSNAYMWLYDWQNAWFCFENDVIYNRYADDVYISGNDLKKLKTCMYRAINGFKTIELKENIKKRRVLKQGKQMNVVGIVINEKINIPKKTRKIIRAMLHNAKKNNKKLTKEQKGLINFQNMVATYKGEKKDNIRICGLIACAKEV